MEQVENRMSGQVLVLIYGKEGGDLSQRTLRSIDQQTYKNYVIARYDEELFLPGGAFSKENLSEKKGVPDYLVMVKNGDRLHNQAIEEMVRAMKGSRFAYVGVPVFQVSFRGQKKVEDALHPFGKMYRIQKLLLHKELWGLLGNLDFDHFSAIFDSLKGSQLFSGQEIQGHTSAYDNMIPFKLWKPGVNVLSLPVNPNYRPKDLYEELAASSCEYACFISDKAGMEQEDMNLLIKALDHELDAQIASASPLQSHGDKIVSTSPAWLSIPFTRQHVADVDEFDFCDLLIENKLFRREYLMKKLKKMKGDVDLSEQGVLFAKDKNKVKVPDAHAYLFQDEKNWQYLLKRGEKKKVIHYLQNQASALEEEKAKEKALLKKQHKEEVERLKSLPTKDQVAFITSRADGKLLENMQAVYDAYQGDKVFFARKYPHNEEEKKEVLNLLYTSKVVVIDNYTGYLRNYPLKPETKVIQIWHACGAFKKFGLDVANCNVKKEIKSHRQYYAAIVSSKDVVPIYAKAFGIEERRVLPLGTPRTDRLLAAGYIEKQKQLHLEKHPEDEGKKILVYAPTFREGPEGYVEYKPGIDWEALSHFLGPNRILLIHNHPNVDYDLLEGKTYYNIRNAQDENTNDLLAICDVAMTDYSSIVFEAALLNKPMIYYCPDLKEYNRDFYPKFPEGMYGTCTENQQELFVAISKAFGQEEIPGLKEFKEKYLASCDGNSARRVAVLITKLVERKEQE